MFIGLIAVFIIGLGSIHIIESITKLRFSRLLAIGLSYPIGAVVIAQVMYLLSLLNIPWNRSLILAITTVFTLISLSWIWIRVIKPASLKKASKLFDLLSVSVLMVGMFLFLHSIQLTHEFIHADSVNYWFLRASMFYHDRGIRIETLTNPSFNTSIENPLGQDFKPYTFFPAQYPLLTPIVISYTYTLSDQVSFIPAKYLWLGIEWAIIILLYYFGRELIPHKRWSGFLPLILLYTIPTITERFDVHNYAYSDVWLSAFGLIAVWMTHSWLKTKSIHFLLVATLSIAGLLMAKVEGITGLWLAVIISISVLRSRKARQNLLVYLPALFIVILPLTWYMQARTIALSGNNESYLDHMFSRIQSGSLDYGSWPQVINLYIDNLLNIQLHGIVWWLFVPALAIYIKRNFRDLSSYVAWVTIFVSLGLYLGFFILENPNQPAATMMPTALTRYASQWHPTVIIFLIYLYNQNNSKNKKDAHETTKI